MRFGWLPRTNTGYMVGDYAATSFATGRAVGVYALAQPPRAGRLDQSIRATAQRVP